MKNKLLVLVLWFSNVAFLQNLVPNPSFEENDSCPTIFNIQYGIQMCSIWQNGTSSGTPDYYAECGNTVPSLNNGITYQYAKTGGAYAGLWGFKLLHFGMPDPNLREYVRAQLLTPLEINRCYYVSMYVNNINWSICGIDNMGIFLSVSPPNLMANEPFLLNANPQVYSKTIIADTLNWIKISGIVQAEGGEQYLTIGNFFQDSLTKHIEFLNLPDIQLVGAYYLIDDVSVIPIDSIPGGLSAYAGVDTTIFIGDSLYLGQDVSNLSCTWYELGNPSPLVNTSPYESSLYVSPTDTTTYVVEQNLCGMITYDTVRVNTVLKAPMVTANASLNFCSGESVTLTSDITSGIVWFPNGETTASITVSESGTYYVTRTFNNYTAVSEVITVNVTQTPEPMISSFPVMCDTNATFTFTEGSPSGGVYTVDGVPAVEFDPNSTLIGDHVVAYTVTNGSCVGSASTVLSVVGCTVGLEENHGGGDMSVFPNPTDNKFFVRGNQVSLAAISLFDQQGRMVEIHPTIIHPNLIEFSHELSPGLYVLSIDKGMEKLLKKIIIEE